MKIFGSVKKLKQVVRRRADRAFITAKIREEQGLAEKANRMARIASRTYARCGEFDKASLLADVLGGEDIHKYIYFELAKYSLSYGDMSEDEGISSGIEKCILERAAVHLKFEELMDGKRYRAAAKLAKENNEDDLLRKANLSFLESHYTLFVDSPKRFPEFAENARSLGLGGEVPKYARQAIRDFAVFHRRRELEEQVASISGLTQEQVKDETKESIHYWLENGRYDLAEYLAREYGHDEELRIIRSLSGILWE
ncbi:hypothetical protein GF415_05460 [Candidatus Micrarchaeota archaeon]|nr:hypothetical protein [Candidatus Micrarchaeota archaeon]